MKRESQTPNLEAVVQRLEKVEAQNRRLKWAAILVVVLVVTCVAVVIWQGVRRIPTVGVVKAEIVEAERFILRDGKGAKRAVLEMQKALRHHEDADLESELPVLVFFSGTELPLPRVMLGGGMRPYLLLSGPLLGTASLKVSAYGPSINLSGAEYKAFASLNVSANGSPYLLLSDEESDATAELNMGEGLPGLSFFKDGKNRARLAVRGDGSASLVLTGGDDQIRAMLHVSEDGSPILEFADAEGKDRARLALKEDGSPYLCLADAERKIRAVLGSTSLVATKTGAVTKTAASSLVLFDKEGKVIFQAP